MRMLTHVDYPHEPGRLYDCPACEAQCHCGDLSRTTPCVYCASLTPTTPDHARTHWYAAYGVLHPYQTD